MVFEINRKGDEVLVSVSGDMTVAFLEDFREKLMEGIAEARSMVFDLSGVEDMDSAAFQLFYSTAKSARRDGKGMSISATSPAVDICLETYRMADYFNHDAGKGIG